MDLALINAVPFVIAGLLAITATKRYIPKDIQTWAGAAIMLALFVALLGYFPLVEQGPIERVIPWVPDLDLNLTFYLDGLSLIFGLIVTGVGSLIVLYTGYYFDDLKTQMKFSWQLMAFAGAMLGLVLSGNLITMFIMWELTSITSFLLIGFKGDKYEDARYGATQALVITGGGGLALLVGVLLLGTANGQILNPEATGFVFNANIADILSTSELVNHPWYTAFTVLLMIGAFTKSAQFPFHFWLPGAMQAPTPASAFLHSATMVKAGVYLMLRLYPPLHESDLWTYGLLTVGLLTFFVGAFFSIKQRDLKGLLAYATVSKLGALIALIGLPHYEGIKAALVGILAHAMYKGALFLVVGTIDHSTGTRIIDKLGGLRHQMPRLMVIAVISALSMAGIPIFFGFVAKEVFLDAFYHAELSAIVMVAAVAGSIFTATAAYILIWDVFFKKPTEDLHVHAMSPLIDLGPGVLAVGSALLGLLITPIIKPLIAPAIPKEFKLYLWPPEVTPEFLTVFGMSLFAIGTGFVIFLVRRWWLPADWVNIFPRATEIYRRTLATLDWSAEQLLKLQNGRVRYYLIAILGSVVILIIGSGLLVDLTRSSGVFENIALNTFEENTLSLDILLLILTIGATLGSIVFRNHLAAVMSLGVAGYAVGGIFLLEPAPDVALVQFLVETLSAVLIIVMLGRISKSQRDAIMQKLWKGESNLGPWRDAFIAVAVGLSVFVFALIAVVNRPERDSISIWHIENTYPELGVQDIVAGILTDFRGTDTFIEIAVFAIAALGVLTLLAASRKTPDIVAPRQVTDSILPGSIRMEDVTSEALDDIEDATSLSTAFTRGVAMFALPFALLVSLSHILYGADAPGDGFTAGVVSGLGIALWYVVFGYTEAKRRLRWLHPSRLMRYGLALAMTNAVLPVLFGGGFLSYNEIEGFKAPAGLHFGTTLLFEIGIALTIFGAVGMIMEAIAHPKEVEAGD